MPDLARTWSRAEVLALPDDGNRYELVDGELLVTPSPRGPHQRGVTELFRLVDPYVRAHGLGYTTFAPADLDLRSDQLVQPDLFVGALIDGREPVEWTDFGIPILAAEVLSPSTARHDRITKRRRYQRSRVGTYWIVDLDARLVEVWTPDDGKPSIVDQSLRWHPDPEVEPLEIALPQFFRAVWAESSR
ncbi:MAG: Uma2 family endonuclease [Gemmatimonadales bacterium]